jgi:integrase
LQELEALQRLGAGRGQPTKARTLLAAVRGLSGRGQHLEAFYGCLYYAALRPSEAVMLRESDLHLPKRGWGRIVLAASPPLARGRPGPTTAPPARNAARSTAPNTRHGPSPSRPSW